MRRYVITSGWVTSKNDGDRHFIGVGQLVQLYQLQPDEWEPYLMGLAYPVDTVFLGPRFDGDYQHP